MRCFLRLPTSSPLPLVLSALSSDALTSARFMTPLRLPVRMTSLMTTRLPRRTGRRTGRGTTRWAMCRPPCRPCPLARARACLSLPLACVPCGLLLLFAPACSLRQTRAILHFLCAILALLDWVVSVSQRMFVYVCPLSSPCQPNFRAMRRKAFGCTFGPGKSDSHVCRDDLRTGRQLHGSEVSHMMPRAHGGISP